MSDATHQPLAPVQGETPRSPEAVNYLFIALCPLIFWMLRGDIGSLLGGMFLLGVFGIAAHLILSALEDEENDHLPPRRVPRKLTGGLLIGLGVALLALIQIGGGVLSAALGLLAFALSFVAFGADRDVSVRFRLRLRQRTSRETRKLVDMTERVLAAIPMRVAQLEDEPVLLQARAFRGTMLALLERHEAVLDKVSSELREVITEAAEATDEFVLEYVEDPDPRAKRRYMVLLKELAEAFSAYLDEVSGYVPAAPDLAQDAAENELFGTYNDRRAA